MSEDQFVLDVARYTFDEYVRAIVGSDDAPYLEVDDKQCKLTIQWLTKEKGVYHSIGQKPTIPSKEISAIDIINQFVNDSHERATSKKVSRLKDVPALTMRVMMIADQPDVVCDHSKFDNKLGLRSLFVLNDKKQKCIVYPEHLSKAKTWDDAVQLLVKQLSLDESEREEAMELAKANMTAFKTLKQDLSFTKFVRWYEDEFESLVAKEEAGEQVDSDTIERMERELEHLEKVASFNKSTVLESIKTKTTATTTTTTTSEPIVSVANKDGGDGFWKWLLIAIVVLVAAMILLKYAEESYDVNYDDFLMNYEILGIPVTATPKEARKAFRNLSLKWHPDKNKGCDECAEKYMQIAEAHKQISDYERGVLHLKNKH